jgi:glycosidase
MNRAFIPLRGKSSEPSCRRDITRQLERARFANSSVTGLQRSSHSDFEWHMRSTFLTLSVMLVACDPMLDASDGGTDAGPSDPAMRDGGSLTCQETYRQCDVEFRFRALDESSVQLRGDFDNWGLGVPMRREGADWVARVPLTVGSQVEYKFLINNSIWVLDPLNANKSAGGNSLRQNIQCESFRCPANAPDQAAFDWRDSVMSFVFVDRFHDADPSNNCPRVVSEFLADFQGGDWKGVTTRINEKYFTNLGVNTLWVTVPMQNTRAAGRGLDGRMYSAYHGYWPSDLESYERCFGTKQDLLDLVKAAHANQMQVLFDFAMVHMSNDAKVYSEHPEWFWDLNYKGQQCVCGSPVCPWDAEGKRCWFTDYLPHWNYTVEAARKYSVEQAARILVETNADGYRLDAIKHIDDSWLLELRKEVEKIANTRSPRPRMYFVGETYDFNNREYLKSFVDPKTKLDGQFDFPLRDRLLRAVMMRNSSMNDLRNFVDTNDSFYGSNALMSTWIGNHDLGRVIHMGEDTPLWDNSYASGQDRAFTNSPQLPRYRRPFERLANAYAFLMTSPGVPLIYYGDEIGLPGAGDPDNRRFMQWTGLTGDQEWLRSRVSLLGQLRKEHSAFRRGRRTSLSSTDDTYVYSMKDSTETLYVAINRSDSEQTVNGLPGKTLRDLYNQESVSGPSIRIPARSARILSE